MLFTATSNLIPYERKASLAKLIQCQGRLCGVAVVGKELFVVMTNSSEMKVYNTDTYSLQTSITVPGLSYPWDMVADKSCVYVSDYFNNNIHRIKLPEKRTIACWQAAGERNGLSITKQGRLLVTCYLLNKVFEYSTDGIQRREIVLQSDIMSPYRAVELDNDQFLIDHDSLGRVCLIDNKGKLIKSFDRTKGSKDGPLQYPRQLVLDKEGCILVADYGRVLLLNSNLEYVKDVIPSSAGMKHILALCLEEHQGVLYVSDYDNKQLAVFHL